MTIDNAIAAYHARIKSREPNTAVETIRTEILEQFNEHLVELQEYFADEDYFDEFKEDNRFGNVEDNVPNKIERFAKYSDLVKIGEGGMGVVYRARQANPERDVAIKVIRSKFAQEFDRRFKREARLAAKLKHPNIVRVYEEGNENGLRYFSMELIDGQDLRMRCAGKPINQTEAARLVLKIAKALSHAHQNNTVHRDVKPSNILIDENGEPHLVDFGLAKEVGNLSDETLALTLIGTREYMSPEQARSDHEQIGPASDIYSLGATLYELLVGRPPIINKNMAILLGEIQSKIPTSPRSIDKSIDTDLSAICMHCLEKSANGRYQSAEELIADLNHYLAGRSLEYAKPISNADRLRKFFRRNPILSGSLAISLFLMIVLAIGGPLLAFQLNNALENEITARENETEAKELAENMYRTSELSAESMFNLLMQNSDRMRGDHRAWKKVVDAYKDLAATNNSSTRTKAIFTSALVNYGLALSVSGMNAIAEQQFQKALNISTELPESPQYIDQKVRLLVNLTNTQMELFDFNDSEETLGTLKELIDSTNDIDKDIKGKYYVNLGRLKEHQTQFTKAKEYYEQAMLMFAAKLDFSEGNEKTKLQNAINDTRNDINRCLVNLGVFTVDSNPVENESVRRALEMARKKKNNSTVWEEYLQQVRANARLLHNTDPGAAAALLVDGFNNAQEPLNNLEFQGNLRFEIAMTLMLQEEYSNQPKAKVAFARRAIQLLKNDATEENDAIQSQAFVLQRAYYQLSLSLENSGAENAEFVAALESALKVARRSNYRGESSKLKLYNHAQILNNLAVRIDDITRKKQLLLEAVDVATATESMPGDAVSDKQFYTEFGGMFCNLGNAEIDEEDYSKAIKYFHSAKQELTRDISWGDWESGRQQFLYNAAKGNAYGLANTARLNQSLDEIRWCSGSKHANYFDLARLAIFVLVQLENAGGKDLYLKQETTHTGIDLIRKALESGQTTLATIENSELFERLREHPEYKKIIATFGSH